MIFTPGQKVIFRNHNAVIRTVNANSVDIEWPGKNGQVFERVTPSGYKRIKVA